MVVLLVMLAIGIPVAGFAIALAVNGDEEYIADPQPTYTRPTITPNPTYTTEPLPTETSTPGPTSSASPASPDPTNSADPQQPNGVNHAQVARANKMYQAGQMQSVGCRESSTAPASETAIRTYYKTIATCLHRAWPNLVTRAGATFREPTILAWTGSIDTPCGFVNGSVSFYCPPNETIYMEWSGDVEQYNRESSSDARTYARMGATHTVAHEYGHHVQNLIGIMRAYAELRYTASGKAEQLELSRRVELQASCFADVFLGANQPTYPISGQNRAAWLYLVEHSGDNYNPAGIRDHGDKASHGFWAKRGFQAEDPAACNTFTASAQQVF